MVAPVDARARDEQFRVEPAVEFVVRFEDALELDLGRNVDDRARLRFRRGWERARRSRGTNNVAPQEAAVDDLGRSFEDFGPGAIGMENFEPSRVQLVTETTRPPLSSQIQRAERKGTRECEGNERE